jgi:putative protease
MRKLQQKTELLAPAGSLEAFFAAMDKGADAVYAGLREFSARAKAKNFTLAQMERMLAYAHARDRRIYVTLNTLVKEAELPQLVETLAALERMGADGVIVQDLAVARLARRYFPGLPVHASTQMTIHNRPGVQQLAELGFERIVLARELHLDEIRAIVAASPVEIECFIHGALCFSVSGQCYFSSFLGGHSGNRGRCAQPCRRLYRHRNKEGYYFSTNDFSAIDLVPELQAAGVASLKIEGRMKSAEYVACVVEAYRTVLDAAPSDYPTALGAAKELLKRSLGRVPTKGFLVSHAPTDIATPSLKGATGRFLGTVSGVRGSQFAFTTRDLVHLGDRLRIQPKTDMAGKAFTVKELFLGNRPVKVAGAGKQVITSAPFPAQVGDAVFKVSSETAFTLSENACQKRLEGMQPRLACDLQLELADGILRIEARVNGETRVLSFPLRDLEPSRSSDMTPILTAQFAKCGDTPFALRSLAAPGFPAVLIPAARFKELRREFYSTLAAELIPCLAARWAQAKAHALAALIPARGVTPARSAQLTLRLEHLRDWPLLHQEGVTAVSFPVSRANLHQLPLMARKLKGRTAQVWWRLPFIIFDAELPWYRQALRELQEAGFDRFVAANPGHLPLIREVAGTFITDYRLFSLNSQALLAWQELGAVAATLYIEDDAQNLHRLLAADLAIPRQVLVYGAVPLITSKIRIKEVRSDAPVSSDRGDQYQVTEKDGLTVLTADRRFSLSGVREQLLAMGCDRFDVDLTAARREEWSRVLAAVQSGSELPGTSTFNFLTELV